MQETIISDERSFQDTLEKIKRDGLDSVHVLADFDRTITKAYDDKGISRNSLISVLRSEGYLSPEYPKSAYALFDKYNPIEIDPTIPLDEKKRQMTNWWKEHLDLLVRSGLHHDDIKKVTMSGLIEVRSGIREFIRFLHSFQIPLVIISASGLGTEPIKMYLEHEGLLNDMVHVISNEFIWDEEGRAIGYNPDVIHVFNKDEKVLSDYPEVHKKVKERTNVILLGDSLGDPGMVSGFEYTNLLRIGFLNERTVELLEEYKKHYDVILTGDNDGEFVRDLLLKS